MDKLEINDNNLMTNERRLITLNRKKIDLNTALDKLNESRNELYAEVVEKENISKVREYLIADHKVVQMRGEISSVNDDIGKLEYYLFNYYTETYDNEGSRLKLDDGELKLDEDSLILD